jgi:hypothetical protein
MKIVHSGTMVPQKKNNGKSITIIKPWKLNAEDYLVYLAYLFKQSFDN